MKPGEQITTTNGVILTLRQPSLWAVVQAQKELSLLEPKPPEIFIESRGRKEVNAADPDYISALQQHQSAITQRIYEILIITGTKATQLPDEMGDSESDQFKDIMEGLNLKLASSKSGRYAQWVKYVAEPTASILLTPLLSMLGTPEKDVSEAIKSLRSDAPGGTDNRDTTQGSNTNGHRVPGDPAGVSARV